jgi:methionine-rich copper-binding protein CopC
LIRPLALAVALLATTAGHAAGHSLLLESTPAAGSRLAALPPALMLRFNNRIEPAVARVRLVDGAGAVRPLPVTVLGATPDRLTAPLPALAAGVWRVEWRVLSADGHVMSGEYEFRLTD